MAIQDHPGSLISDFSINRKHVCDFLLVISINLGFILPCFRGIADFLQKKRTTAYQYGALHYVHRCDFNFTLIIITINMPIGSTSPNRLIKRNTKRIGPSLFISKTLDYRRTDIPIVLIQGLHSRAMLTPCNTRKPCCRKETARCRSCSFRFKVRRRHSLQV